VKLLFKLLHVRFFFSVHFNLSSLCAFLCCLRLSAVWHNELTPWSRVLLQNLTGPQVLKKFPTFYGTWRFITAFTSAYHLSLSWARSIQSMPQHITSWRCISIFSFCLCLGLPSGLFSLCFRTRILYVCSHHMCYMSHPSILIDLVRSVDCEAPCVSLMLHFLIHILMANPFWGNKNFDLFTTLLQQL